MARPRPRRAARPPLAIRIAKIATPIAVVAAGATGAGIALWPNPAELTAVPATAPSTTPAASNLADLDSRVSRSNASDRPPLTTPEPTSSPTKKAAAKKATAKKPAKAKATKAKTSKTPAKKPAANKPIAKQPVKKVAVETKTPAAIGTRFVTTGLNLRTGPGASYDVVTVLSTGSKVSITGKKDGEWSQVVRNGKARWVKSEYLSTKKPKQSAKTSGGISGAPCASGSKVEAGLTSDAIRLHRALCARFPQIKSFGGVRADYLPEHPSGRALDAMISDSGVGWEIANWVRDNRRALGVSQILYAQKIWTVQRGSEGWRSFSDRGSATANHYDHVHISVYGNSGG